MRFFDVHDWYWSGQLGVFSSAAKAMVHIDDATYEAWLAGGGLPTPWPKDEAGAETAASLDEVLAPYGINTGLIPAPFDSAAVKAECQRRIYAVASQNAQMNMTAAQAAGVFDATQEQEFKDSLTWVHDMRAVCAALITAADATFANDAHWPACPADVAALAAQF